MQSMPILILGFSGSGKSRAVKTLNPAETFLINCGKKPLPFKNSGSLYTIINSETNPSGNMITTKNYKKIHSALDKINDEKPEINNIVIDDSHELIIDEFMQKHSSIGKGTDVYQLYNSLADHFYQLVEHAKDLRDGLFIYFLHHAEQTENGRIQTKTIGRLLNEKIEIPSKFTIVLYAVREVDQNYFLTQNDGMNPAKSPEDMFPSFKIENDLQAVRDAAILYFSGEKQNAKTQ